VAGDPVISFADVDQKHGEVCPANWEEGKEAMNATRDGVASYLSQN
jgi:peroxiredoxin (alkyl hydroperoxide reductase subunit C)